MPSSLHIAVCGAGPAGLSAALALSRLGHRITLFDQFDRPKPLGSGLILQPTGLAVLDALGLGTRIRSLGARIDRLYGRACGSGRVVLDVRYAALGEARGLAVHRAALFNVLHDAVRDSGIEVQTASRVMDLDGTSLVLHEGRREGPFDLVVDALGSRSPLIPYAAGPDHRSALAYGAIWASLPWPGTPFDPHALEQRYDKASVMIGVLPSVACWKRRRSRRPFSGASRRRSSTAGVRRDLKHGRRGCGRSGQNAKGFWPRLRTLSRWCWPIITTTR